jgi:hypothetical protein
VLGYKQELKRQMTYYGSVGTTLGCSQVRRRQRGARRLPRALTRHTAPAQPLLCAGVFYFAFGFGGPVSVIWGFVGCFVWCFFLALSLVRDATQPLPHARAVRCRSL